MPVPRRILALTLALTFLTAACGDDDVPETSSSTSVADDRTDGEADAETGDEEAAGSAETDDDAGDGTVPDAEAEDPPGQSGGEDEGLGDTTVFVADLSGVTEVPGPGDAAGTGRVEARPADDGRWCFDMVAEGLHGAVADAHIHEGAAGASGDVVIEIGGPTSVEGDVDTWTDVCVAVDVFVEERLLSDPATFYANVHTADFPDGAIRGQLEEASIFDLTLS